MRNRLLSCLGIQEDAAQHKINARLRCCTPDDRLIEIVLKSWFQRDLNSGFIQQAKEVWQKKLISLLTLESSSKVLGRFKSDVFSLALACAYVEKQDIPEAAAARDWYKLALIDHIESKRLHLRVGNLQFYRGISEQWDYDQDITEHRLFSYAKATSHPSFPLDSSSFKATLTEQTILLTTQPRIYRFSSPTMKKTLMRLSDLELKQSESLAIANLLGNYGSQRVLRVGP